ncbi:MAG: CoA pyrophosphatase [Gammaproteobacteria bacterium]|jgi:8-oxo-dGTP pyrophosphatase MutT (NUDIX family)|nr:CoA pyrophosphatase [Gammaproteobacteria bacterium]
MTTTAAICARLRELASRPPGLLEPSLHAGFRRAAVLLPLWRQDEDICIALTRRADHLTHHRGQIAFPGGGLMPGEDTPAAALRETHEELGIEASAVELLGRLDDAWSVAGFHVVPWVGWLDSEPRLNPDPGEVEQVLTTSLARLGDPANQSRRQRRRYGMRFTERRYHIGDHVVWGLSADILRELLDWLAGDDAHRAAARAVRLRQYGHYVAQREVPAR